MLQKVVTATVLLALATLAPAQTDECDHDYLYVNAGDSYAGGAGDISVSIACVDADGCASIVYVQAGCNGCFDPLCTNGVSRVEFTSTALGGVVTVDGSTDFSSGGISDGDLICSTGQLSVASRNSATVLTQAHEWNRASLAGLDFAYMNFRGNIARCFIYSFEGSSVTVTEGGVAGTPFTVNAFAFSLQINLDAITLPVIISSSDNPILVTCYEGTSDYTNVPPLLTGAIYGYDSRNTFGVSLDCSTLSSTLGTAVPTCEDVAGNAVTVSVDGVDETFEILGDGGSDFLGNAFRCTPPAGSCLSIFTHADSDGNEGVHLTNEAYGASFFVVPLESRRFAITSIGSSAVTCDFIDTDGTTVLQSATTAGTSTVVKDQYVTTTFSAGVRISCGSDVIIISSFNEEEYTLNGRESESLWSYSAGLSTCSPTSNPTSSPTNLPSVSPTTPLPTASPSREPTTQEPTSSPSGEPTASPSREPTTLGPTSSPSSEPTTEAPTTEAPTTEAPTTEAPTTEAPTTEAPTSAVTSSPTTASPTSSPSRNPTTDVPTSSPSVLPTASPTLIPTASPTTPAPTVTGATSSPSASPTTDSPTASPTTTAPSSSPSTTAPTSSPTTSSPSASPTTSAPTPPTVTPTAAPTVPTTPGDDSDLALVASLSTIGVVFAIAAASAIIVFYRRRRRRKELEFEELLAKEKKLRASEFEVEMEAMI